MQSQLTHLCDVLDKLVLLKAQQQRQISMRNDCGIECILELIKDLSHNIRVLRRRRDALKKKI